MSVTDTRKMKLKIGTEFLVDLIWFAVHNASDDYRLRLDATLPSKQVDFISSDYQRVRFIFEHRLVFPKLVGLETQIRDRYNQPRLEFSQVVKMNTHKIFSDFPELRNEIILLLCQNREFLRDYVTHFPSVFSDVYQGDYQLRPVLDGCEECPSFFGKAPGSFAAESVSLVLSDESSDCTTLLWNSLIARIPRGAITDLELDPTWLKPFPSMSYEDKRRVKVALSGVQKLRLHGFKQKSNWQLREFTTHDITGESGGLFGSDRLRGSKKLFLQDGLVKSVTNLELVACDLSQLPENFFLDLNRNLRQARDIAVERDVLKELVLSECDFSGLSLESIQGLCGMQIERLVLDEMDFTKIIEDPALWRNFCSLLVNGKYRSVELRNIDLSRLTIDKLHILATYLSAATRLETVNLQGANLHQLSDVCLQELVNVFQNSPKVRLLHVSEEKFSQAQKALVKRRAVPKDTMVVEDEHRISMPRIFTVVAVNQKSTQQLKQKNWLQRNPGWSVGIGVGVALICVGAVLASFAVGGPVAGIAAMAILAKPIKLSIAGALCGLGLGLVWRNARDAAKEHRRVSSRKVTEIGVDPIKEVNDRSCSAEDPKHSHGQRKSFTSWFTKSRRKQTETSSDVTLDTSSVVRAAPSVGFELGPR